MNKYERMLVGALAAGVWTLALQVAVSSSHAQDVEAAAPAETASVQTIHATDIVGLSAFVQQTVRDIQFRPQTMPGLDQHIRSVIRNCRVNGYVTGDRLSGTSLSC